MRTALLLRFGNCSLMGGVVFGCVFLIGVRAAIGGDVTRSINSCVARALAKPRRPLLAALNPPHHKPRKKSTLTESQDDPLKSLSQALVFKPDLGACQSFKNGCREGAIVTMPTNNAIQTLGAGLGMRIGGVRFEYAYGIHTGANFIGIRSHIP